MKSWQKGKHGLNLNGYVKMFPTPLATDALKCPSDSLTRFVQPELRKSFRKRGIPTPVAGDWRTGSFHQLKRRNLKDFVTTRENNGKLNPAWVEWLMGFPIGWTELPLLAMRSSRRSRSSSQKESRR